MSDRINRKSARAIGETVLMPLMAERDAARADLAALRAAIDVLAEESADYSCKSEWDQRQYDSVVRDLRALLDHTDTGEADDE